MREFHPEARRLRGLVAAATDLENPEGDAALQRLRDQIAAVLRSLRAWRNCVELYEAEAIEAIGQGALLEEDPSLKMLHRLEADAHRGFDRAYRALCKLRGGSLITEAPVSPPSSPSPEARPRAAAPRRPFVDADHMAQDADGVIVMMRIIKRLEKSLGRMASEDEIQSALLDAGHVMPAPESGPCWEGPFSGITLKDPNARS
jgi:hypothetical protein